MHVAEPENGLQAECHADRQRIHVQDQNSGMSSTKTRRMRGRLQVRIVAIYYMCIRYGHVRVKWKHKAVWTRFFVQFSH